MNQVILLGRLTADPQSGETANGGKKFARFSLAVKRFGDGVDFINIIVWDKLADTAINYLTKGKQVAVVGRIQTGSYERDGVKRITFDVCATQIEFVGSKDESAQKTNGDLSIDELKPVDDDDDMPF